MYTCDIMSPSKKYSVSGSVKKTKSNKGGLYEEGASFYYSTAKLPSKKTPISKVGDELRLLPACSCSPIIV